MGGGGWLSSPEQRLGKPLSVRKSRKVSQIAGPYPRLPLRGPEFMSCGRLLFSCSLFFSSILFFCPLFRSRFWLGRGTANTRLDLGTETTWIRAPQVLGYVQDEISQPRFETRPEFLNESRRRVPSPTCLLYPAVKWKIHSLDQQNKQN